jgi:phage repressor protein C with HTH and peptisase S24 domain
MHEQMERLYRAAKELKGIGNKAELARALNQSFQTVKNWEKRGMSKAGMLNAQAELGCSATWLETGEGSMTVAGDVPDPLRGLPPGTFRPVVVVDENDPRVTVIPKVRLRLTAGISGFEIESELEEPSTSTVPTYWMNERGFKKQHLIAIDVRGESMEPTFYAGDTVVLNTADKVPVDGGVFAINYEGEPIVKRMTRDAGEWWLTSDNADQRRFPRKLCQGDGCIIIGRVVRRETERF